VNAPDGTSVAYQVINSGPVDLRLRGEIWSNIDLMWERDDIAAVVDAMDRVGPWSRSSGEASPRDARAVATARERV
jgi:hypothetical protein